MPGTASRLVDHDMSTDRKDAVMNSIAPPLCLHSTETAIGTSFHPLRISEALEVSHDQLEVPELL